MKISLSTTIAALLVVGATGGAATVSALTLPSPYQGSDTLFDITTKAISNLGLTPATAYIGGGSGNAVTAMVGSVAPYPVGSAAQQTGPMSRLPKNEANDCSFNGAGLQSDGGNATHGEGLTSASGIVLGLDAVDIVSSTLAGAQAACNTGNDGGLTYSGSAVLANANQSWKDVLALVYGGLDLGSGSTTQDCTSAKRKSLVANWSNLFQSSCTNTETACAGTIANVPVNGALWHAYRRDDGSGTADVFASTLGLNPGTSIAKNNGFGASPYCNALNWDTAATKAKCNSGSHELFTGPGGIPDPQSTTSPPHRMPPAGCTGAPTMGGAACATNNSFTTCVADTGCTWVGVWGSAPDPTIGNAVPWDVLPTSLQDNDPIRRPCLSNGSSVSNAKAGEDVCNLDGALGLVLSIPAVDFIEKPIAQGGTYGFNPFATNQCGGGFTSANPIQVITCAPAAATSHAGECPDGDQLIGGVCQAPTDPSVNPATTRCFSFQSNIPTLVNVARAPYISSATVDGHVFNLFMLDGTGTYIQQPNAAIGGTLDFAGGVTRIHSFNTIFHTGGTKPTVCSMDDASDQIGCLAQADPCSIGFAGDGSKTWGQRNRTGMVANNVDSLEVFKVPGNATTVKLLGQAGEYPLARKLYFVSLIGFNNVSNTAADSNTAGELNLATNYGTPGFTNPLLGTFGFFTLGTQSGVLSTGANQGVHQSGATAPAADTQFCEDVNEQTICNSGNAPANVNGCPGNSAATVAIPTNYTICGDATQDSYEECDDGANNGKSTSKCSATCRCTTVFVGAGNGGTGGGAGNPCL